MCVSLALEPSRPSITFGIGLLCNAVGRGIRWESRTAAFRHNVAIPVSPMVEIDRDKWLESRTVNAQSGSFVRFRFLSDTLRI